MAFEGGSYQNNATVVKFLDSLIEKMHTYCCVKALVVFLRNYYCFNVLLSHSFQLWDMVS